MLKYLNGMRYLKLKLSVDSLGILKWYVDGSHNVHWDCKGHRGAVLKLGKGAITSYSRKVKLNTRSSTETELYMADMFMPEILWSLHFIQAQGYEIKCVGLYQDNISTQLLIKNGKMSSRKKTKHIKAKFFFIKDRIDDREIRVLDCPAKEMWADVMTKPLQGTAFWVMQAELMNCLVNYNDPETKTVTWKSEVDAPFKAPQECDRQNSIQTNNRQRLKGLLRKLPRYSRRSTSTQLRSRSTGTCKSTSTLVVQSGSTSTHKSTSMLAVLSGSTSTRKSNSMLLVSNGSASTQVGNNAWLGTERPVRATWQVGVSRNKGTKQ
jgi:hypothetical protein